MIYDKAISCRIYYQSYISTKIFFSFILSYGIFKIEKKRSARTYYDFIKIKIYFYGEGNSTRIGIHRRCIFVYAVIFLLLHMAACTIPSKIRSAFHDNAISFYFITRISPSPCQYNIIIKYNYITFSVVESRKQTRE